MLHTPKEKAGGSAPRRGTIKKYALYCGLFESGEFVKSNSPDLMIAKWKTAQDQS